jgi:hypothetical protein
LRRSGERTDLRWQLDTLPSLSSPFTKRRWGVWWGELEVSDLSVSEHVTSYCTARGDTTFLRFEGLGSSACTAVSLLSGKTVTSNWATQNSSVTIVTYSTWLQVTVGKLLVTTSDH